MAALNFVFIITGVNENIYNQNEEALEYCAGKAGYAASIEFVSELVRRIDLGTAAHREECGITDTEVLEMLHCLLSHGFKVEIYQCNP